MSTDKIRKNFATNLKKYMVMYKETQIEVSEIAGVSQQSVSNWLNEKQIPRLGVVEKLAAHYKVTKSDLLEDREDSYFDFKDLDLADWLEEALYGKNPTAYKLLKIISSIPEERLGMLLGIAEILSKNSFSLDPQGPLAERIARIE